MNDIKHIWTILCSNSSLDQNTNNLSLFNVIEQLQVKVPNKKIIKEDEKLGINIALELVTLWNRDPKSKKRYEQKVDFVDPNGKILDSIQSLINMPDDKDSFRMIMQIGGLKATTSGKYHFRVSSSELGKKDFIEAFSLPLKISID